MRRSGGSAGPTAGISQAGIRRRQFRGHHILDRKCGVRIVPPLAASSKPTSQAFLVFRPWQDFKINFFSPASGPATSSFNGLHPKSNFLAIRIPCRASPMARIMNNSRFSMRRNCHPASRHQVSFDARPQAAECLVRMNRDHFQERTGRKRAGNGGVSGT